MVARRTYVGECYLMGSAVRFLLVSFFFLFPVSVQASYWTTSTLGGGVRTCSSGVACARTQQDEYYPDAVGGGCYGNYNSFGTLVTVTCDGRSPGGNFSRTGHASLTCEAGEERTASGCVTEPPAEKERKCSSEAGNPVDLRSGMKVSAVTDFTTAGQQSLTLQRFYVSEPGYLAGGSLAHTRLGQGWRTNYDSAVFFVGDPASSGGPIRLHIALPTGTYLTFGNSSDNYDQQYFDCWS